MRKMTTKKALEITIAYYKWKEKNPKSIRADWPGWKKIGITFSVLEKSPKDPLCQVADGDCEKCPMISFWMKDAGNLTGPEKFTGCLVKTSYSMIIRNATPSKTKKEKDAKTKAEMAREVWQAAELFLKNGVPEYEPPKKTRVRRERPERVRRTRRVRR